MPLPLYLLALAVFAMGTSEFMLAGLLPDIAAELGVSIGAAGSLTSAFAIGMIIGAPLMAAAARNWPRRSSLLIFVLVFLCAHLVGAVSTGFVLLFVTRILAALANAGFLAVAISTAAALVSPDRKGRALAVLLSGTTMATIAGVPGGAVLGALAGWRATFVAVALLCVPAAIGILRGIPAGRSVAGSEVDLRVELAQLRRAKLILVMLLGALVNAATFGSFTFLGPIVTDAAGLDRLWVPVALIVFGVGSLVGVTMAGRLADQHPGPVVFGGGSMLLAGWVATAVLAGEPRLLLPLVFVQGALSFGVGSTLIAQVLHGAAAAPTMAGAYATAALNVGAAVGPLIAALTLTTELGVRGPMWASAAGVAAALLAGQGGYFVSWRPDTPGNPRR